MVAAFKSFALAALLFGSVSILQGCGGGGDDSNSTNTTTTAKPKETTTTTTTAKPGPGPSPGPGPKPGPGPSPKPSPPAPPAPPLPPPSPSAANHTWEPMFGNQCTAAKDKSPACDFCEGEPNETTSKCVFVGGFDFGSSITGSQTDESFLMKACSNVANGYSAGCANITDQAQKGACEAIFTKPSGEQGGGNTFSISHKPACDPGMRNASYNQCRIFKCPKIPKISELDGQCTGPVGCRGALRTYTYLKKEEVELVV